jgi:cytosine/adenosine deaminase-related metal-dependent hydrolase
MAYRKFSADRIFDGRQFLGGDTVLILNGDGKVEALLPASEAGEDVERLKGTLLPGLVNAHCHLELSHLKDVIPPHTGLVEFLVSVVQKRDFSPEVIREAIDRAEAEMYGNGIVAVGDIGNTTDTINRKIGSAIRWQNFVEVLSFTEERTPENLHHYQSVLDAFNAALDPARHRSVLVPHAPYSISPSAFRALNLAGAGQVMSIHNQEHPAEDELYRTGGGDYLKLFRIFGIDSSPFPVTGLSSIRSYLPYFDRGQKLFLVHNTFMDPEDLDFALGHASAHGLELVICICINANLYIENRVPPLEQFIRKGCRIVLGTDSYSSNWQLSIGSEVASIRTHFPSIPEEAVLQWATLNGAMALGWDDELGSFDPGKKPGLALLDEAYGSRRIG